MKKIMIAILIVIAVAVTCYYTFPDKIAVCMVDAFRSKAGLAKKEIQIDDHRIVYLEGGRGPTILLLHGYTGNKDNWTAFAGYLTANYHVVIPDLPGYGESSMIEKDSYDLKNQITRLHRFTETLKLGRFHIAGNSMGGLFAGTYAVRHPDEVISVGLFDAAGVRSLRESTVTKMRMKGENPLVLKDSSDSPRLMALVFEHPPSLPYPIEHLTIRTALTNRDFYQKELKEFIPDLYSLERNLRKIKAPTLILWGQEDKIIDVSSVPVCEKGLRDHKTVIIRDCGHVPMMEKAEETANHYLEFVRGIKN